MRWHSQTRRFKQRVQLSLGGGCVEEGKHAQLARHYDTCPIRVDFRALLQKVVYSLWRIQDHKVLVVVLCENDVA